MRIRTQIRQIVQAMPGGTTAVARRLRWNRITLHNKIHGDRPLTVEQADKIARLAGKRLTLVDIDPNQEGESCPTSIDADGSGGPTTPIQDNPSESVAPPE